MLTVFISFICLLLVCNVSSIAQSSYDMPATSSDRCTAMAIGGKASIDGSVYNLYNADCAECDWRINKVPAADYPVGSLRPIYLITGSYPRAVRSDHGATWTEDNLENIPDLHSEWSKMKGEIIGYIPQVQHTFAYIEGLYGIMNEHQVAIGESTCASKLYAGPIGITGQGKALLEVSELSQIALERAKTAREAIEIMGNLAVQYGFYSADWDDTKFGPSHAMGEGGEALTVTDSKEAWVFHIIPDDTKASAIWVAQRVPDNNIAVVANQFIIRNVIPNHPDFLYSSNLWSVAKKLGWWSENDGLLNFLKVYAPARYHPNYSNRRVWRIFDLVAPALKLTPFTNSYADDYPFSVEVQADKKLNIDTLKQFQMDHYEGTQFSTTVGLAAGPYGDPNRYDIWSNGNMSVWDAMEGEFPRAISLFRTSYSLIAQSRAAVPDILSLVWISQYAPDSSSFIPLYVASTQMPLSMIRGTMHKYDTTSYWWNCCVVGNYVARFYSFAIVLVREVQAKLSNHFMRAIIDIEATIIGEISQQQLRQGSIGIDIIRVLTDFTVEQGNIANSEWKDLFPTILTRYRDGYVMDPTTPTISFVRTFYPKWWLTAVGYFDTKGTEGGILFDRNPTTGSGSSSGNGGGVYVTAFLCVLCISIGYIVGSNSYSMKGYTSIPSYAYSNANTGSNTNTNTGSKTVELGYV